MLLVIVYAFFSSLLLFALIKSNLHYFVKATIIVLAVVFYTLSYYGWKEAQGWPSTTELPDKFFFHHGLIQEPNKEAQDEGKITLWVSEVYNNQLADTPRAFELPYSRQLHAQVEQAMIKTKDGRDQIGFQDRENRRFRAESDRSLAQDDKHSVYFIDLEESALPEK